MAKSINDKLKESVKASLAQAEQVKKTRKVAKKKTRTDDELSDAKLDDEIRKYIGLPLSSAPRPKNICVYRITYHNRARLDHIKYPNERMRKLENSPLFATRADAYKWCRAKEKEDPINLYFTEMTRVPEPEVPKDVMKKVLKRGW